LQFLTPITGFAPRIALSYNHLNLPTQVSVKKDDGSAKGTITYTYDATGRKLHKDVHELNVLVNGTTTLYLGAAVYESKTYSTLPTGYANYSNQLQLAGHEEGRLRAVRTNPQDNLTQLVYDYTLKDHLGNVRMVLTEEVNNDAYSGLSFEGEAFSTAVTNQAAVLENSKGQQFEVINR